MPRQRCCGLVKSIPGCQRFIPEGVKKCKSITLKVEEVEAVRLKDMCEMDQTECADAMGLSRATFQRILRSARSKIAFALVEGQAINIDGGNFAVKNRLFECLDCGKQWEVEPCATSGKHGYEIACPACGSMKKAKIAEDGTKTTCGGHGHGGGCCGGHH